MNRNDIIRMAREAGMAVTSPSWGYSEHYHFAGYENTIERFAALVAAAERETVASWMMQKGYATGHGDTVKDLLTELEWQAQERAVIVINRKGNLK